MNTALDHGRHTNHNQINISMSMRTIRLFHCSSFVWLLVTQSVHFYRKGCQVVKNIINPLSASALPVTTVKSSGIKQGKIKHGGH